MEERRKFTDYIKRRKEMDDLLHHHGSACIPSLNPVAVYLLALPFVFLVRTRETSFNLERGDNSRGTDISVYSVDNFIYVP